MNLSFKLESDDFLRTLRSLIFRLLIFLLAVRYRVFALAFLFSCLFFLFPLFLLLFSLFEGLMIKTVVLIVFLLLDKFIYAEHSLVKFRFSPRSQVVIESEHGLYLNLFSYC